MGPKRPPGLALELPPDNNTGQPGSGSSGSSAPASSGSKKPARPALQLDMPQPPAEGTGMKITDTMTLVVAEGGREIRVKDGGVLGGSAQAPTPVHAAAAPAKPEAAGPRVAAVLNKISFSDLRIGSKLGAGAQGSVRKVQHTTTLELYALKSVNFTDDKDATREAIAHELVRIEALKHEKVVSSFEAYFREGKLYILMEYMNGGTMVDVLKRRNFVGFPEPRLALVAKHLLQGLEFLHSSNVVHRDIKPVNLLCNTSGLAKISDFGVASTGDDAKVHMTAVGSTPYMSPERIQAQPYTAVCDIWSAGLALAELAIGQYPFGAIKTKIFELCQLIAGGHAEARWDLAQGREFSDELKDFVAQCLRPHDTRPSATELLKHPFVQLGNGITLADQGAWYQNPV